MVNTGLVYSQGIAGNWLWWSFLPSGMMTVFLFARLETIRPADRRAVRGNALPGKPAAFLRGFRAVYLGLLMNCFILGWVTKAMTNIVGSIFGKSKSTSLAICIFFLIPFTGFYVSLGGLWGVLWTDLFQFVLKMSIVIAVAYYGVRGAGGMHAMLAKLSAMRDLAGPGASNITAMFPDFSRGLTGEALWTLPVLTFLMHLCVRAGGPSGEPWDRSLWRRRLASRKEFSARGMSVTGCSPCCGSTSRTMLCGLGRGF